MEKSRPGGPERPAAVEAEQALREADAAAEAAKTEAERWGGADKLPSEPEKRFW
ncbi:hypothetical protein [Microbacterium suwonense]|nr:hypothetical protein [Microbacterium suwonense]